MKKVTNNIKISSKLKKIKPWATKSLIKVIRHRDHLHLQVKKKNSNNDILK
jgi:hypothetical protein